MNVDVSTVIAFSASLAGIAATWGGLRAAVVANRGRITALEADLKALKELQAADRSTIEFVRTDQGRRLGELEKTTNGLVGKFDGFQSGFGAGRRSRTAAQGHKVGEG